MVPEMGADRRNVYNLPNLDPYTHTRAIPLPVTRAAYPYLQFHMGVAGLWEVCRLTAKLQILLSHHLGARAC